MEQWERQLLDNVKREVGLRSVQVYTIHPTAGKLWRGTIRPARSSDWRGCWSVADYDSSPVTEEPIIGDYLDAEQVLLDATAALDETEDAR